MKPLPRLVALLALAACAAPNAWAQAGGGPEREITRLRGDLYRFRETRHVGMFLVTAEGIIVVDPTNTGLATWLKGELTARFGLPVKYVVYSHAHNDHASGGGVFADTAIFVGHENMLKNLERPAADALLLPREQLWDRSGDGLVQQSETEGTIYAEEFARWDADGNGGLDRAEIWAVRFEGEIVPPDVVYSDRAVIRLGGKRVELHYTGRNHTDDMTVVLFPEERTIYTADFLTPNRPPRTDLDGGFLPDWVDSLRRVEQLEFDIVSPAHEAPGSKAQVVEQRRYLEELVTAVAEGIAAGQSKAALVESVRMENYAHLIEYDLSRPGNVAGAYEILSSQH